MEYIEAPIMDRCATLEDLLQACHQHATFVDQPSISEIINADIYI